MLNVETDIVFPESETTQHLNMYVIDQNGNEIETFTLPKMLENLPFEAYQILEPEITLLADGGWVVSWYEGFQFSEGFADAVFCQAFDASGQNVGETATLWGKSEIWGDLVYPGHELTPLSDGGYVATWPQLVPDSRDPLSYVWMQQAFNSEGIALTKSFKA